MSDAELFTALYDRVVDITGRPDLVDRVRNAVISATRKAHYSDYWLEDLVETTASWPEAANELRLDISGVTNWRRLSYARAYIDGAASFFYAITGPDNVLTLYGEDREAVCYEAGTYVNFRSITPAQTVLLGYFARPDVSPTTFTSWVASQHPDLVVYDAARLVFSSTDRASLARNMASQAAEQYEILIAAHTASGAP